MGKTVGISDLVFVDFILFQASMKIHSQGCMAVISLHMRENITVIVAIIVGTLFIQVLITEVRFSLDLNMIAVCGPGVFVLPGQLNKEGM